MAGDRRECVLHGLRVINLPYLAKAAREVLTARDNSMGSSGGTTLVIMRTQSSSNLDFFSPRSSPIDQCGSAGAYDFPNSDAPLTQTYQLAAIAKMSKNPMNKKLSKLLAETRSVEKIIVRTSCPCVVPNPVLRTTARQPPSGVILEGVAWRTLVPENKAALLCPPSRSRRSEGLFNSIDSLRRGVDSPESIASLTMQLP